ncbi:MAG: STAS domain-containing protein [Bacillota bacterium]|nr:STAS domain-containing protein [Bacillota bacterium]
MDITKNKDGGKLEIKVSGRLDTTTAPQLDSEIKESVDGVTELIFDLGNLEYISSAGLRVLLASQKTMNKQGEMKVTAVSEPVMEIFEVTGFSEILTIV